MNISEIGKSIAFGIAGVIAISSALIIPNTSFAEVIYCSESAREGCIEKRGSGGSDALVVEELRQQTYRMRDYQAMISTFEITRNKEVVDVRTKPTEYQTVIPYPENFKTIGEVQAELAALEALENKIEASVLSDEIKTLKQSINNNKFSSQFSDIEESKNKSSIEILDAMNILSGRENGEFSPNEVITRKEAIKISELIAGKKITIPKTSSISDIDDNDWSVPYMETAIENKIIYRTGNAAFEGDSPVFVEEAFALYLNATQVSIEFSGEEFEKTFSKYLDYAAGTDIEYTISNYAPNFENESITRGEFAELSLYILNVLRREEDYEPTQQLNGEQYSASQAEINNPQNIFPKIFKK